MESEECTTSQAADKLRDLEHRLTEALKARVPWMNALTEEELEETLCALGACVNALLGAGIEVTERPEDMP
ncbi:hypothetical protein K2224_15965 [Streptomyces sp. BHT-5-2]|uniref:hypothetical protein n=1 Tax=unclassified Streptomyces TaxID=2593676 RepID=UPI001C8E58F0|nr:hypothetical protein [Streptomyces sp. BHT-5-2]QZL04480.1 hypothetical protein K2224_15965 [Streptomyces sp. BHT-5-2]